MYKKYSQLVYDDSPHSPHTIVIDLVKSGSNILDIGCNGGHIGEKLIEKKQCSVCGVDVDLMLLKQAKKRGYKEVFAIDLYQDRFRVKNKYDYILFLDVLEHLPNPQKILNKFVKENLKKDGTVIISLPNIARLEIRLQLLLGKFNYSTLTILNPDHLRHFTLESGKSLIINSGLKIKKIIPTGLGHRIKVFPTLIAFQFIYVCQKLHH